MKFILNLIWIVFGGFLICLEYIIASLLLMVTIIGIPFGLQTIKLGLLSLYPFGQRVVTSSSDGGCVSVFMNVIWILLGGIIIVLSHLIVGLFFCFTIIGIPFGMQHFKLAGLALSPFGKHIE